MWYVYILKSLKNGQLYKGLTNNIDRRLDQHFKGRSKYTKRMLPLELVYVEIVNTRIEAREREKYVKSGEGRDAINDIARM